MPKYTILPRMAQYPRVPTAIMASPSAADLAQALPLDGGLWAVDIETRGVEAHSPDSAIVGIGFANVEAVYYVDLRNLQPDAELYLKRFLLQSRLSAFNVGFDGTFLQVYTGQWLNWTDCSYGLAKQMSGEGFRGQSWSLDTMITDVLGWNVNTKAVMAAVLKERGMTKATMWQLPAEIIGPYCASDADAAWQLRGVLYDVLERLP